MSLYFSRKTLLTFISVCAMLVAMLAITHRAQANEITQGQGIVLTIDGAISPASADYLVRGIDQANEMRAPFVILQMDTPGGLDKSMRTIIKSIIASRVPVISYVAPSGARAASAGTYISYASHVAAMAPGTNLGAASPVSISGAGNLPETPSEDKSGDKDKKKPSAGKPKSAIQSKVLNDAVAYIKSLAALHGRNEAWAEEAVTKASSLSAKEALAKNVVDLIAEDIPDLLKQCDGREVKVSGATLTLKTQGKTYTVVKPDLRTRILTVITDPSVAYILFLIGVYGLFFEFANPGFVVPGVAGAICIVIAMYAFQLLPINYAGLGLIMLGIAFMVGEAFMPSFGALGIGGVIAFIVGSFLLINPNVIGYGLPWGLILFMAAVNAVFFGVVLTMALRARSRDVVSGQEAMVGQQGVAIESFEKKGKVKIGGEIWVASSKSPIKEGETVEVLAIDGLVAKVRQCNEGS